MSDLPEEVRITLSDGAAITSAELRALAAATICAALPLISDTFVLQLVSSELDLPYVQACVEDDQLLELEISAPSFTDLAPVDGGHDRLIAHGWNAPLDNTMPNYWIVVNTSLMSRDELADFLLDSLDELYAVFSRLPMDGDLGLEVRPLALAAQAFPDHVDMQEIELRDET